MPELEMDLDLPPAPPVAPKPGWLSFRLSRWLIFALVLALGTAAALAIGRTIDRRPAQDRAAIAVAMAYVDASNAHDWPAIQRTVTADAELIFLGPRGQIDGTYSGKAWEDAAASTMEGFHLALLTEPIVARGSQVSFAAHMTRTR
jgi:hypothetical protein